MSEVTTFAATQIGVFNPGRLSDNEIERAFVTRIKLFEYLLKGIISETPESIPQHYLVIGQRGMGKSTLLHRIAVELRKEDYREKFIPLTFPEEQYNVDRLSKFWLNCLDALADALDREGSISELTQIDRDIRQWAADAKAISPMDMYENFAQWAKRVARRPVLLADNLGLIFDRLSKEEQHQLRAILMNNGAPILVGASSSTLADTVDYGAPFYDAFQIQYLKKLTFEETQDVLRNLGEITNNATFVNGLIANKGRLRTLHQLTGGTPRTVVMLYPLVQNGFSMEVQNDLESLMDTMTPLYKARFEELSEQMQVVLDAVALYWAPIAIDSLREITQLENQQLSPQLKRLTEVGWLERLSLSQKKGYMYQISERFFNIWYLMRRSNRRQKKELLGLTEFLVFMYGEELTQIGKKALLNKSSNKDQVSIQLAIAGGIEDSKLAKNIERKSYEELIEMSREDTSIRKDFYIPEEIEIILSREGDFFNKIKQALSKNNWLETNWAEVYESCEDILSINPDMSTAKSLIGYILERRYHDYYNAELAYKEAISMDERNPLPLTRIGDLYKQLGRYEESQKAYTKAIRQNESYSPSWIGLGDLYYSMEDNEKAEDAYLRATKLDPNSAYTWSVLANVYQNMGKYEAAERSYLAASTIDESFLPNKLNLMQLYRDNMNRVDEARDIFERIGPDEMSDFYWLNMSLFALYDRNIGIAETYFVRALEIVKSRMPSYAQGGLWRYASISLRLGYGKELLYTLKNNGYDIVLRPYYVAIQSLIEEDSDNFLNSIAVEVREAAADVVERIKKIR